MVFESNMIPFLNIQNNIQNNIWEREILNLGIFPFIVDQRI